MNGLINTISILAAIGLYFLMLDGLEDETISVLYGIGMFIFLQLYFIPSRIADYRNHRNKALILVMNALGGWTAVLWVGALLWAVYVSKQDERQNETKLQGSA